MQNTKLIQTDISLLDTLKLLSEAYEEISVMRMRRVKDNVLSTRNFLSSISSIFANVKASKEVYEKLSKSKKKITAPTVKKTVSVLLSPNAKLYGEIVYKVFRKFVDDTSQNGDDIVILGKVGRQFYEEQSTKKPFVFFDLSEFDVNMPMLKPVIYHLSNYDVVKIYHGKFESLISQSCDISDISGDVQASGESQGVEYIFIYEPSLESVLGFFETQIFGSLMKQTVNEDNLSRYASRIKAMESALENINLARFKLTNEDKKARKQLENRKQMGVVSGVMLSSGLL